MSRTYKDKPHKLKHEPWDKDLVHLGDWYWIEGPTTKAKKRKEVDHEWHWMTTPGWWVKMTMNKPERRAAHLLERKALTSDIEDFEIPDFGRKPHIYFW